MDPADVSKRMRAVRREGTPAETQLESALRERNLRFTTHEKLMGFRPDIVFGDERLAVFVDGDFWHGRLLLETGHDALRDSFRRRSRTFWVAKIERNVTRDLRQVRILRRHGWAVLRFWEKDVLSSAANAAFLICQRLRRRQQALRRRLDVV
jgi:DNA mismatch endonuclease Vsr